MMEMLSKRWSRGLRIEDAEKEARVPWGLPHAPADSLPRVAACPASPPPTALWVPYANLEVTLAPSQPHAFLLGPVGTISWVGTKRTESRKRGPLSKPPATTAPWVRARPRGRCPAPSPRPSLPREECVLGGSPDWRSVPVHRGGCVLPPVPSEAPIVRPGAGGGGQAGGMSQRPNVLRGGKAEGPPRKDQAMGHLALLHLCPEPWLAKKGAQK